MAVSLPLGVGDRETIHGPVAILAARVKNRMALANLR